MSYPSKSGEAPQRSGQCGRRYVGNITKLGDLSGSVFSRYEMSGYEGLEDVPRLDHLVRQFLGGVYWIASYYRSDAIEKGKTTADISMLVTAL